MGLFDRKYCDICGEKLGLILGHRKLEDGMMCKDCEAKLSPLFQERRASTVDEIREQLAYRERNKSEVAAFNTTATYGTSTKIYLDEGARKFMVTSASNIASANPDVIRFDQITGCRVDVQERKREMKHKDQEGNSVSYDPPIYSSVYDFYMIIDVNAPYFNEIRFRLNNREIEIEPEIRVAREPRMQARGAAPVQPVQRVGQPVQRPGQQPQRPVQPVQRPGQQVQPVQRPAQPAQPAVRYVAGRVDPFQNDEYCRYAGMAEDIRSVLIGIREEIQSGAYGYKPAQAVVCASCGATTMGNENGCCEYCGSPL